MQVKDLDYIPFDEGIVQGHEAKIYTVMGYQLIIMDRLMLLPELRYKYQITDFAIELHKGYAETELIAKRKGCRLLSMYIKEV